MRTLYISLLLLLVCISGCNYSLGPWELLEEKIVDPSEIAGKTEIQQAVSPDEKTLPVQKKKTPKPGRPLPAEIQTTIADIDAVGNDSSLWTKQKNYKKIASRNNLSEECQHHLTHALLDNLLSETAKEDVLITLINNPSFMPSTEKIIIKRLDNFITQSSKQRILSVISVSGNMTKEEKSKISVNL